MNFASKTSVDHVRRTLTRPYRVTLPMVALVSLVPFYLFIARANRERVLHAPAIALDHLIPLQPVWSLIYGALYLFLIVLPVLVIAHEDLIRRAVRAYLLVWLSAYACFLLYPTVAPRPGDGIVPGSGFGAWGLRILYDADPPLNCFPSLHVAHSFVGAFAVWRMHSTLGAVALTSAVVVGLSTLFTKQHYVLDVAGGVALAAVAYMLFIRGFRRSDVSEGERQAAPAAAAFLLAGIGVWMLAAWLAYRAGATLPRW